MIMIVIADRTRDVVLIDRDASIVGAADSRTHGRRIAASTNDRNRGHLGDEDTIELGIRRHRMRARRLRDLFDQRVGFRVDHAEHGCLLGRRRTGRSRGRAVPTRSQVVATVALVEPHLVGPGNAGDRGLGFGRGIDDERDHVARIVLRRAAQDDIVIRSDAGSVGAAFAQGYDPGIRGRIECADDGGGFAERLRVDHNHATIAGDRASQLPVIAARGIVGDDRDRYEEAPGLGIPCRLLKRQPEVRWDDRRIDRNFGDDLDVRLRMMPSHQSHGPRHRRSR